MDVKELEIQHRDLFSRYTNLKMEYRRVQYTDSKRARQIDAEMQFLSDKAKSIAINSNRSRIIHVPAIQQNLDL